jgi:hypothetical protein
LKRKIAKIKQDYEDVNEVPDDTYAEFEEPDINLGIVEEIIYKLKISHIDELQKSPTKSPQKLI